MDMQYLLPGLTEYEVDYAPEVNGRAGYRIADHDLEDHEDRVGRRAVVADCDGYYVLLDMIADPPLMWFTDIPAGKRLRRGNKAIREAVVYDLGRVAELQRTPPPPQDDEEEVVLYGDPMV